MQFCTRNAVAARTSCFFMKNVQPLSQRSRFRAVAHNAVISSAGRTITACVVKIAFVIATRIIRPLFDSIYNRIGFSPLLHLRAAFVLNSASLINCHIVLEYLCHRIVQNEEQASKQK